jgi:hypothetical protein
MGMATTKTTIHTQNFASAVKIVHGRSNGLDVNGQKLVEASGLKERGFPRTDMKLFGCNLRAAAKAGLIRLIEDKGCLWVAV